jgi:hypothetical protein
VGIKEVRSRRGHRWVISRGPVVVTPGERWGACVLMSSDDLPVATAKGVAEAAISASCSLVLVVSPNAEAIHDQIDDVLIQNGADEVVTTWDSGPDGMEKAIGTVEYTGLAGPGVVRAFTDFPRQLEAALTSGVS